MQPIPETPQEQGREAGAQTVHDSHLGVRSDALPETGHSRTLEQEAGKEDEAGTLLRSAVGLGAHQAQEDEHKARELGDQMDRCKKMMDEIERDISTLIRSQDYYRKKMRKLGVKRDRYLNLRLL